MHDSATLYAGRLRGILIVLTEIKGSLVRRASYVRPLIMQVQSVVKGTLLVPIMCLFRAVCDFLRRLMLDR